MILKPIHFFCFHLFISFILIPYSSEAFQHQFHPEIKPALGYGLNVKNPNQSYPNCYEFRHFKSQFYNTFSYTSKVIESQADLNRELGFSSLMDAYYLFHQVHQGPSKILFNYKPLSNRESLTWLVAAQQKMELDFLKNLFLRHEYHNLSVKELSQTCGPEIVTEQHKTVSIFLLMTFHGVSSEIKELFKSTLSDLDPKTLTQEGTTTKEVTRILEIALLRKELEAYAFYFENNKIIPIHQVTSNTFDRSKFHINEALQMMKNGPQELLYRLQGTPTLFKTLPIEKILNQSGSSFEPPIEPKEDLKKNEIHASKIEKIYNNSVFVLNQINRSTKITSTISQEFPTEIIIKSECNLCTYQKAFELLQERGRKCWAENTSESCETLDIMNEFFKTDSILKTLNAPSESLH